MSKATATSETCRQGSIGTRRASALGLTALLTLGLAVVPVSSATAAEETPVGLGTAGAFAVLAGATVTNTGDSVITGSIGLAPGTAVVGFPPGEIVAGTGSIYTANAVALQAKADLTTAFLDAAGRVPDPTATGLSELDGLAPVPGAYSGGALQLTGTITLNGDADDVWIFQAASSLTIGSGSEVVLGPEVSPCNVFWQVTSSATINTGASFVGTVLAGESIFARTGATIEGRLLTQVSEVTLDDNVITRPVDCAGTTEIVPEEEPETTPPVTTPGTTPPVSSAPPVSAAPPATPIAGRATFTG